MFLKIVQKWKAFKDYCCAFCEVDALRKDVDSLKKDITGVATSGYCIGQEMGFLEVPIPRTEFSSEMLVRYVKNHTYCPRTLSNKGRFVVPCDNYSCPCCAANHRYVAALAKYKNAEKKLRAFKKCNSKNK